jgi:hypothetical protein
MIQTVKGPFTAGVFGLTRLVAESAAFQRRTKATDWKTAQDHIEQWGYKAWESGGLAALVVKTEQPRAAIWPASRVELTQYAGGDHNYLKGGGSLTWVLADADRFAPGARDESAADFAGWVDAVLQDIRHNAGRDGRLGVYQVGLLLPFAHSSVRENASYWQVVFVVDWRA